MLQYHKLEASSLGYSIAVGGCRFMNTARSQMPLADAVDIGQPGN